MDVESKRGLGCVVSTVLIVTLIVVGLSYFAREFQAILTVACIFVLPFLPAIYIAKRDQRRENIEAEYAVKDMIQTYTDQLEALANDIEDYDPKEYDESPQEYLDMIQAEIESIRDQLKHLHESLEDYDSFRQQIMLEKQSKQITNG